MSKNFPYNTGPLYDGGSPRDLSLATHEFGPHLAETTQRFIYGTRFLTWDGKVYKYSKSSGRCYTGRGNVFNNCIESDADGIDYAVLTADAGIGSTYIKMTNTGTAITEDFLAGGQITLKPTETYTDAHLMFRTIIGNSSAAATSGVCTIYLDSPLEIAMTTSNYAFAMPSPYNDISYTASSAGKSFAGLAATYISASGYNFWTQTYGACWIAPHAERVGAVALKRMVFWREDGSVDAHSQIGTNVTDQLAGVVLDNNDTANGSTVILLQCSI